jgi:hypothetical protein
MVLEQLAQNADRNGLMLKTYPFTYTVERTLSEAMPGKPDIVTSVDTLLYPGEPAWTYRPGTVMQGSRGAFRSRNYAMRLPSLRDFASREFIAAHCFHVAGVEEKAGQRLLRLDAVASERLREIDVNVAIWLDTAEYRIRFAKLTLTRIPDGWRHLARLTTEITYLELIPFVPVMYLTDAENLERAAPDKARRWLERHQILDVGFLGARPDDPRPDSAAVRPPK